MLSVDDYFLGFIRKRYVVLFNFILVLSCLVVDVNISDINFIVC